VRAKLAEAKKGLGAAELRVLTDDCKLITDNLRKADESAQALKAISKPFLNWAGKAERLSFDVPTLPLFVHERLSTKAIIETLTSHKRDKQIDMFSLFGDPQHSFTDQILRAYEYQDKWVNRMILGDSLVVMNSLLHYEGLGGQVQMIYMDPPYGVKFGSNFQPFVRQRDVVHNDDEDMTREPEMVQAYRDTWELGLHSYLTYMRDRLLLARDLLTPSGSIFVQISDENLHHVRELLDEIFGNENFCVVICYRRLGTMIGAEMKSSAHYLLWYAKDKERQKFQKVYDEQVAGIGTGDHFTQIEHISGETRPMTPEEKVNPKQIPVGWRPFQLVSLQTYGINSSNKFPIDLGGGEFLPGPNKAWRTTEKGVQRLIEENRLQKAGDTVRYKQFLTDFPFTESGTIWEITGRDPENFYVVQTPTNIIARCINMATDPGDLVLDPTCGSGTTAYVAEQWGRRWITMDTSRVPLALARQRLLTATFPWYELNDNGRGPAGGFVYMRKQNNKGEEVGGIVPHVTLKSIANNEPPEEEVLVDRPETDNKITRVTGAFCVEGTIPTPVDLAASEEAIGDSKISDLKDSSISDLREGQSTFTDRMLEILRKSPLLRLEGNRTLALKNIRPPAKTLSLSAEALVDATAPGQTPTLQDAIQEAAEKNGKALALSAKPVALVFGPENGAISERLVQEAAKEAWLKSYTHLYVIGFAIQPNARQLIENCDAVVGIPATYIQATPDLMMGDLLKNMRSSQIFSVCGLPEIKVHRVAPGFSPAPAGLPAGSTHGAALKDGATMYQVELLGLDVFDPITMEAVHRKGNDVPAWFLDTDYNGLCFHVSQAFFPRTSAWDNLKKALKSEFEESVWDHLSGTTSAPFEAGENRQVAVKVIDDRGNELMVVERLI
jgi:adenine-specific DNA-methyltransferase